MQNNRRDFLKQVTRAGALLVAGSGAGSWADAAGGAAGSWGVLVDTTLCIGCRSCEKACNGINTDLPRQSPQSFQDESVFGRRRRMDEKCYTVVNRYAGPAQKDKPVYAKFQCMHCLKPACVSACIVGALEKKENGAVVYDAGKCIGCRYCMIACPFQVPAYEYKNALTPKVRKCTFCFEQRLSKNGTPACVAACPMQVMLFGRRPDLITIAGDRIRRNPGRYISGVYGAHEAGGTAWMYLSSLPFKQIDLPQLGYYPVPGFTEPVQHVIFKWFLPPLGLYALLGGLMWRMESRQKKKALTPETRARHESASSP
jgi:Fe-S-cluster-containing dehydrogenase component